MKITLEFNDVEKFFVELPRFAALMSMAGEFASFDKIKAQGLEALLQEADLPEISKSADGAKLATGSPESVEKLKEAQSAAIDAVNAMTKDGRAEQPEQAEEPPFEEDPKKSTPKNKKPAEGQTEAVRDTDVRKMLNKLIKSGHRDDVKSLLAEFGAANFSKLNEKYFAEVMKRGQKILEGDADE